MLKIGDLTPTADDNGNWTDGNVAAGISPTRILAGWLNAVQGEIINVIEDAGIEVGGTQHNQLSLAIKRAISERAPDGSLDVKGLVQLDDSLTSSSITKAATANAVRKVNAKMTDYDELFKGKVSKVNGKSPDTNANVLLTAADVDAVSAASGGAYGGAISARYTESYGFGFQYATAAPFYNAVSRAPNSEFHPLIKQQFHIPGYSACVYSFGVLNGGDGSQDFKLHILNSSGTGTMFSWGANGDYHAPGALRCGTHVYSAYHLYAGGGQAYLRNDGLVAGPVWGGTITEWLFRTFVTAIRRGSQQYVRPADWTVTYEIPDGYITGFNNSTNDGNLRFCGWYFRVPMFNINGTWVNAGNY